MQEGGLSKHFSEDPSARNVSFLLSISTPFHTSNHLGFAQIQTPTIARTEISRRLYRWRRLVRYVEESIEAQPQDEPIPSTEVEEEPPFRQDPNSF